MKNLGKKNDGIIKKRENEIRKTKQQMALNGII